MPYLVVSLDEATDEEQGKNMAITTEQEIGGTADVTLGSIRAFYFTY